MKTFRPFLFTASFFLLFLSARAQDDGKYYSGFKAGFGIPKLTTGVNSTPLNEGYASRLGFYSGIIAELRTSPRFGFRAEINYSAQGGIREGYQALPLYPEMEPLWQYLPAGIPHDDYMYADIKSEAILNYLEIPVMGKYRFGISPKINIYLQAGPYLGILLNAKNITSGMSEIYINSETTVDDIIKNLPIPPIGAQSFDHTENITSDCHRFNLGVQGALGLGLQLKSGEIFLEGGGNYGFVPIQKDEVNGTNHTGAATVNIGYLFSL